MAVFGPFSAVFRTIFLKIQDDRCYAKMVFPMRVCSFMAIQLSKDGKWVFYMTCTTLWCHAVVHFEVKRSRF